MRIVLHSDDVNLLEKWEKALVNGYEICYEFEELKKINNSIIIINATAFKSSIKDELQIFDKNNNRVLVFQQNPTLRSAKEILKNGAKGYGNVEIKNNFFLSAIETISDGMVWLHSEFTTMLLNDTSSSKNSNLDLSILSKREKEVVVLLKDGISYKDIAKKLSITPRTVKAHARNIYMKLHVKDRFALALLFK